MSFKFIKIFILILVALTPAVFYNNCSAPKASSESASLSELSSTFSGVIEGELLDIEPGGIAFGWASAPANLGKSVRVHFYVDGDLNSGNYAGSTLADVGGAGLHQGHYFSFQIPSAYLNGVNHTLYAYAHVIDFNHGLNPSGDTFRQFSPKAENVYNQNLKPLVQNTCSQCHTWDYKSLYYGPLQTPSPFTSGRADNNTLINKLSGGGHQGGQFCNTKNDFPCSAIKTWWTAEFN